MYTTLYQYLLLYRELSLPGIGTIHIHKTSSEFDFGNKWFTAPAYHFKLESEQQSPSKRLFAWLSKTMQITDWEAIKMVNDFSFNLKSELSVSGEVNWKYIGRFFRDDKGNIAIDPALSNLESELPVAAEKVIREKSEHKVLVGDNKIPAIEMEEFLHESPAKKDYGWIIAIVAIVLSIMVAGVYLSEKGIDPSSLGNQNVIQIR